MKSLPFLIIVFIFIFIFTACKESKENNSSYKKEELKVTNAKSEKSSENLTDTEKAVFLSEIDQLNNQLNANEKYQLSKDELELLNNEKLLNEEEKKDLSLLINNK